MGVLKKVGNLIFGKDPDIFDEKGRVRHRLPKKTWEAWHNKMKSDPQYNWRNHTGMGAGKKQ